MPRIVSLGLCNPIRVMSMSAISAEFSICKLDADYVARDIFNPMIPTLTKTSRKGNHRPFTESYHIFSLILGQQLKLLVLQSVPLRFGDNGN